MQSYDNISLTYDHGNGHVYPKRNGGMEMTGASMSGLERQAILKRMESSKLDVLIIGGGITGAGIALDAASRGMKTALVEMQDFSSGTSSRSTKLVHGGLRYLKQFHIGMVAEVGRERAVVYRNGPHVTQPEWMLLPLHKGGTFGKLTTSLGLLIYDYLAQVSMHERRRMLSLEETIEREPLIKKEGLRGSGMYVEYKTDDARLTIEVIKEAVQRGAAAVNYAKVVSLLYDNGQVCGAIVTDQLNNNSYEIRAAKIINASGPWVDTIRELDQSRSNKRLVLTKGIHLVIDRRRFPLKQAVYFDTPDGRMVFAIPRDGKTYVGTTDTFYESEPSNPRMEQEDRRYLLEAIHYMFPKAGIQAADVESSWAGVRPLIYEEGKSASEISRKDEVWQSPSGLITIAGGKLTGYRMMAENVVNLIAQRLRREGSGSFSACMTKDMPISGGDMTGYTSFEAFVSSQIREGMAAGLSRRQAERLARKYGSNATRLYARAAGHRAQAFDYGLGLDEFAILNYSIEEEMCVKPTDFFVRRTGALYFDIRWVYRVQAAVIRFMADRLHWNEQEAERYKAELADRLKEAVQA
jgi:glycerol-3-phosphate dehydrogenase